MKNTKYNLLFIVLLSFSFLGIVNAETTFSTGVVMSPNNGVRYVENVIDVNGVTCEGHPIVDENPVEVKPGIQMSIEGGSYKIVTHNQKGGETVKVQCKYDFASYFRTNEGVGGAGTWNISIGFVGVEYDDFEYSFSLNTITNKQRKVTGENTPFSMFETDEFEFQGCIYEDKYLTCAHNNSVKGVIVNLKDGLVIDNPVNTDATITFKRKSDGSEYKIFAHIEIKNTATIIADFGGAVCEDWPEGWNDFTAEEGSAKDKQVVNKKTKKEFKYNGTPVPMPSNCTYNGTPGLTYEFAGWYVHDRTDDGNTTVPSGVCVPEAINGSIDWSKIDRSEQYERILYTCFKPVGAVILSLNGSQATLDDNSGFSVIPGEEFSFMYKKDVGDGEANLPTPRFTDPSNRMVCWRDNNTKQCYNPGDSVKAGEYVLEFETDTSFENETEISMDKQMVIGTTDNLNPSSYLDKINSCSSTNGEVVSANFDSNKGICTVSANKLDSNGVVVNVRGTKDNKEYLVKVTIKVVKNNSDTSEGKVISAASGLPYDVTGFLTNSHESLNKCANYSIKPVYVTAQDKQNKLIKVIGELTFKRTDNNQTIKEPINDNIYTGQVICDGQTVNIAAVCLDPSRQEPSDPGNGKSNYILDHKTSDDGSYLDNLTIVIYKNGKFKEAVDHVASGNTNAITDEDKREMAAATLAYRILSIKVGEDANDNSAGLANQYYAYKALVKNIDDKWKSSINQWKTNSSGVTINSDYAKGLFCDAKYATCSSPNTWILAKAANYIKDALNLPKSNKKISVSAYVSREDTSFKDSTKYTKIIEGKFTGIPTDGGDHFLSIRPTCEQCKEYGVNVSFEIGRNLDHLVQFDEKMNALAVTYNDFPTYHYNDYNGKHLFNEDGTMVFRYTVYGDISVISNKSHEYNNYGSAAGQRNEALDFRIATSVGLDGEEYKLNTGQANASGSVNFQRMEIFHKITGSAENTNGNPYGRDTNTGEAKPCGTNCGWGDGFKLNASPSVRIRYNRGGSPKNMIINYNNYDIGSFLPACDFSIDKYNYKNCTSGSNCTSSGFDPVLFVGAGCCSRLLDESHYVYKTYCNNKCVQSTYTPICKASGTEVTGNKERLVLHEAVDGDGENYTCIYDTNGDQDTRVKNTYKKKDSVGNKYAQETLKENKICAISCKEDWDFSLPNMKNLLGPNAVIAGQYFVLGRDTVATTAKRTCVTSKIDIEKWNNDVCDLSERIVRAFNGDNVDSMIDSIDDSSRGMLDGIEYKTTDHKYCPNGYYTWEDPPGTWHTDYDSCDGTDFATCTTLDSVVSPTISYHYYTFDNCRYVTTHEGSVSVTDDLSGINKFEIHDDGSLKTCDNDIDESNYIQKRGTKLKELLTSAVYGKIQDHTSTEDWGALSNQRDILLRDMKQCQYWAFSIRNNNNIKDDTKSVFKVQNEFDPSITYTYDEPEFMTQLAGHNTLVRKDMTYTFTYNYYGTEGFDVKKYHSNTPAVSNGKSSGTSTYNFSTNKDKNALIEGTGLVGLTSNDVASQRYSWCTSGGSGSYVSKGDKTGKGAGAEVSWDDDARCDDSSQEYLKNAYYIKKSAELKSQYDSDEYKWYVDMQNGFRQLGKDAKEAASRSKSTNKDDKKWSIYGESSDKRNMVFPISETTPRNIYQYSFSFHNIGNYNDNNNVNLGRILGNTTSVVGNNNRVCFYEVIEGICYCCGDVLETELVTPSHKSTREILNRKANGTLKPSGNDLSCNGDDCDSYLQSYVLSKKITENDVSTNKGAAQYGVSVNSVSLNSITEDSGGNLGANWSDQQHYTLDGFVYVTDKGANLLKNIEETGENIYDTGSESKKAPEYSYTLSPEALSIIRTNNQSNGYQEKASSMVLFGTNRIVSTSKTSWDPKTGSGSKEVENPVIGHYASKFLNDTVSKYVTSEYTNQVLSRLTGKNSICYVVDYDKNGFKNLYNSSNQKVNNINNCRWIDYVGVVKKGNDDTKNNAGTLGLDKDGKVTHYYRLSFK